MKERKLLFSVTKDDLVLETFKAGGKGGQNQNKRDTGVRLRHLASGAIAESRESRSQLENKRTALKKIATHPKFRFWVAEQNRVIQGQDSIEEKVEKLMEPANMIVEVKNENGKWTRE